MIIATFLVVLLAGILAGIPVAFASSSAASR